MPQPRAFLAVLVAPLFLWAAVRHLSPAPEEHSFSSAPPPLESTVVDTILVYGPQVFATPTGSPQHHVERFAVEVVPEAMYTLRVENGTADGRGRASRTTIRLNGSEVIGPADLDGTVAVREVTVQPSVSTTLEVTVAGQLGSHVTVTIWTTPVAEYAIYGPVTFRSGVTADRFALPESAPGPYRLRIENGGAGGASRVTRGSVRLNGTEVVSASDFGPDAVHISRRVDLVPENDLEVEVGLGVDAAMSLRITATDVASPVLRVASPEIGATVTAAEVEIVGTVQDETPVHVRVNGLPTAVAPDGRFALMVSLPQEGPNALEVVATDQAGHQVTELITVYRDTEGPALRVDEPAEGATTTAARITVSGQTDPGASLTIGGASISTGPDGSFRGDVPLSPGLNVLTIGARDSAGHTTAETRQVIRAIDRLAASELTLSSIPTEGLRAHLVADSLASSLSDGAPVDTWPNTGSEADAAQANTSKRSTFHAGQGGNSFNGHAHVGFNEGSDNDEVMEIANVAQHGSGTLILVFKQDDAGAHSYGPFAYYANSTDRGYFATRRWCCVSPPMAYWDQTNSWKHASFTTAAGTPYVAVWRVDSAATNVDFQVNGSAKGSLGTSAGLRKPFDRYLVGAPEPVTGSRFDGQIAELLFYDRALTDVERNNVVVELANTYGITVSLPSAPPAAPTGVTATAINFQRIDLDWTDASAEEDGYRVERRIGQAGSFVHAGQVGADVVAFTDAGVPSETELCYRVIGFNVLGDGAPSDVACATTPAAPALQDTVPSSGLRIHLEADNLASALSDGADVGAWPNHGTEADAVQWSTTQRSTFRAGQPGNLFGGHAHVGLNEGSDNDEWLEIMGVTGHGSATLIAVFADQSSGETIHDLAMLGMRDSTAEKAGFWSANKFTGPFPYQLAWWDASNGWKDSNLELSGSTPYIVAWTVAGGSAVNFQVNGDAHGSPVLTNPIPTPFDRYRVAKSDNGQASRFDGQLAELILYDRALSDGERDAIVYNLGQKYSITVSVPPPPSPPNAPSGLVAIAVDIEQIDLTWTDNSNDEEGFKVQRRLGQEGTFTEIAQVDADIVDYEDATASPGNEYCYRVIAFNGDGDSSPSNISCATTAALPPDPATVAPAIDPTVVTTVLEATEFLYTGTDSIQTGVEPGTIDRLRAAVLLGRVLNQDGTPLSGATVTIRDHTEFGQTVSRADGAYDMVVNGGGRLTVQFDRAGFLSAQRPINVPWQDWLVLEDVVLVRPDPQVTTVDFSDPIEVARGTPQTDADGTRQATLMFPQGTQATMTLPDSTTQPLSVISVRATEVTVGVRGPEAMPAPLPPTTAYTYAVDVRVEEAAEAGAVGVEFDQPVLFYVENFLGFPVGIDVPVGRYDPQTATWIPEQNGRVIGIIDIQGGLAEVDVDGDGAAADSAALAALGITVAERQELANLYAVGTSLWRAPMSHLSWLDLNWPFGVTGGPPDLPPWLEDLLDQPCRTGGSIIECQNQTLGERIAVTGIPYTLNYRSDRSQARESAYTVTIPLVGDSVPAELIRVEVEVSVAGRVFQDTLPAPLSTNQEIEFVWDGLDVYGRELQGEQPVTIRLSHVYPFVYTVPATQAANFGLTCIDSDGTGSFSQCIIPATISSSARQEGAHTLVWTDRIGTVSTGAPALGGWTLDVHHAYDPLGRVVHLGDGTRREDPGIVVTREAGTVDGFSGDGGPAKIAQLANPFGLASGPDGSYYIADTWNNRIRKVAPDGTITTVAGSGEVDSGGIIGIRTPVVDGRAGRGLGLASGDSLGDGGPATHALLDHPQGVAVGPDGSLYIADTDHHRIRRVSPNGIITTVAGDGTAGFSGDGGPATEARIGFGVVAIAVDANGALYIGDEDNHRIRRVGPDGTIVTMVGDGANAHSGDGGLATAASLRDVSGLTVGPDGSLYFTDPVASRIRKVTPDGVITTIAGNGQIGFSGDGGPANQAALGFPIGLELDANGNLYFSDRLNDRVRRIDVEGTIATVAGDGTEEVATDGALAAATSIHSPTGLAIGPGGQLYVADGNDQVLAIRPAFPGLSDGEYLIPAEDGSEVYVFDSEGRHLRSLDALTAAVRDSFSYDQNGLLTQVTDGDGNVMTIERDGSGTALAIQAPFGQETTLSVTGDLLTGITNPASETIQLDYHPSGLLASLTDARMNTSLFTYDEKGRLTRDEDAADGFQALSRIQASGSAEVTKSTALGRTTSYLTTVLGIGAENRTNTSPSGLSVHSVIGPDGSTVTTQPDGTTVSVTRASDPRFAMGAPVLRELLVETPGGIQSSTHATRRVVLADPNDPLSLVQQVDSLVVNGRVFTNTFTASQREVVSETPEGRVFVAGLDSLGRVVRDSIPGLAAVQYVYDGFGRLSQITQGLRTWSYGYDQSGRLQTVIDPLGQVDSLSYDSADRLSEQTLPDGRAITFGYDAAGNLTSVTPPGRPAHGFDYTPVDLTASYTPPDLGPGPEATIYSYNVDRQLTQILRPDSLAIDLAYDTGGRASSVTTPIGTLSYAFDDSTGNLASVTATDALTSDLDFSYDGSLLTDVTWSGPIAGSVIATHDNDFRVISTSVNGGNAVSFAYDQDGLLTQAGALAIARDTLNGLITGTTLQSVTTTRAYNALGEWSELRAQQSGSDLFRASYARDGMGRITVLTEVIQGDTTVYDYEYDPAGRLIEVKTDGAVTATYSHDTNGNRISFTGPGGTATGSYDAQDRILSYAVATYEHTRNGELKRKIVGTDTTEYVYDVLGNLKFVELPDGTQIEYVVDGFNRRVGKKVNGILVQGFLYEDQISPVAELDAGGQVSARFVYGTRGHVPDYMVKGGATYRIVTDHLGSVRRVVDAATGTIAQRIDYDAFGRITLNTNPGFQPFGFAGGVLDQETGLTRFGARDYDSETGRWTAKDPIGFKGQDPNLYGYVLGDPINLIDPSGEVFWDIIDIGFFLYDLYQFYKCPTWGNFGDVGLDFFGLLPGLPSPGYANRIDDLWDVSRSHKWGDPTSLDDHFRRHGSDFGAESADDYAKRADDFFENAAKNDLPTKIDADGVTRVYDPTTNTFGAYNPDGTTKTFFKPPAGSDYWARQPGRPPVIIR